MRADRINKQQTFFGKTASRITVVSLVMFLLYKGMESAATAPEISAPPMTTGSELGAAGLSADLTKMAPQSLANDKAALPASAPSPSSSVGPTKLSTSDITRQATTADGHYIETTATGARIRCGMQDIIGDLTYQGLRIHSVEEGGNGVVAVTATAIGRGEQQRRFDAPGQVMVDSGVARLVRPGLVEEVTTSSEGIRQDWVVLESPSGQGNLELTVCVADAQVTHVSDTQVSFKLADGRGLVWRDLLVHDANGKTLPAQFSLEEPQQLRIAVTDADATYPIVIDPTFTDADWVSMGQGPGTNYIVNALAVSGGDLYVGGQFWTVADGAIEANNIAKWDGSSWSALGSGTSSWVYALAVSGSDLYVGGSFSFAGGVPANNIAKWDGSGWSALGSGMNNAVLALAVSVSGVYAGGSFSIAGGVAANHIAKWDGSGWSALGSGTNNSVRALAISGSNLYVGGGFTSAGGVAANAIAKWNGSSWSALGSGLAYAVYGPSVLSLVASGSNLYVGGDFNMAGGVSANNIAKWNGISWSALGSGLDGAVNALAMIGGDLYAGGSFSPFSPYVAKWNGSGWSTISSLDGRVYALAVSGSDLYIGGYFVTAGGVLAKNIAKWNGSETSVLGSGLAVGSYNVIVYALAVSGSDLYVGGNFYKAGNYTARNIAKWDGSKWSPLGSGMNAEVRSLAVSGSDLYAGGDFTTAGGVTVNRVAKWNGSGWSALGSGMNDSVYTLAMSGSDLYAGGFFTTAGGGAANYVAKWNGSGWSALGSGTDSTVRALVFSGSDLYAGGTFSVAGGGAAKYVAKWNGSNWSPLGSGMNQWVSSLVFSGSDLYAGGEFTTAGGGAASHIAKWNGSGWSALGSGTSTLVRALTVFGGDLYVGGEFGTAGGISASGIAKWDGSGWSALGSGTGSVCALAVSAGNMYVGGGFGGAGGKVSPGVAMARLGYGVNFSANGGSGFMTMQTKIRDVDLVLSTNIFAKTGHTFSGWDTQADGLGFDYADGALYSTNESVTLYAQWTPNTYGVSFNANTGTGSMADQTKTYGVNLTLSANAFTKTGYTFDGWNTQADGIGTDFSNGATYSANAPVTLYAQWTNMYAVSFNANTGAGSIPDQIKMYGIDLILSANTFTKTGHTFAGWNTKADGLGSNYANGETYSANAPVTLYAQWTPDTYTVSFNANTGTGILTDQTKTYGVNLTLSANTFTKADYTFYRWNTQADGFGADYADGATYSANEPVTLYAQWTNIYSVSFGANGGNGLMADQTKMYGIDLILTANTFTRSGFTFTGWNTAANGSGISYSDGGMYTANAPATLYAVWNSNSGGGSNNSGSGGGGGCGLGGGISALALMFLWAMRSAMRLSPRDFLSCWT